MKIPTIYGFNKCSDAGLDTFAPSVFVHGCNMRCPYCMNKQLVNDYISEDRLVPIDDVKKYISENKPELIMISGGEPTYSERLSGLIEKIRSWGCKVGISTNGVYSESLRSILPLLNYVALDIKTSSDKIYQDIGNKAGIVPIIVSKSLLTDAKTKRADFDFEIRTTLYPPFIDKTSLTEIGMLMRGDERWVLQQFRKTDDMLDYRAKEVRPYNNDELKELLDTAKIYTSKVELRYV